MEENKEEVSQVIANQTTITVESPKEEKFLTRLDSALRQVIAPLFWVYAFVKLFVFDLDNYLVQKVSPDFYWVIQFKFIILLSLITVFWLLTKNQKVIEWFLYIIFYPFILFFWKIPRFLWRRNSAILTTALLNAVLSFFQSFKFNFITATVSLLCVILVFVSSNKYILIIATVLLPIILIVLVARRFTSVFRPSALYKIHLKIVSYLSNYGQKSYIPDPELSQLSIAEMTNAQKEKWGNNLQNAVMINKGCYYFSSKLLEYKKSGVNIIFYILSFLSLYFVTILFFTLMNLGLYKIDSAHFTITVIPNFFNFLFYTFNNFFLSRGDEIIAISDISRLIYMVEVLFAFLLGALLVTLFFNVKKEKDERELESAISQIKLHGDEMEQFINKEYKLTVADAIQELNTIKSSFIKIIFFLSK